MSDEITGGRPNGAELSAEQAQSQIRIISQYAKDISFENPRPPAQLPHTIQSPEIELNFNINATALNEEKSFFEVVLKLEARAQKDGEVVFIAEIAYAAVMELRNVPDDMKQPLTMIEGPRMIFPFARRILADLVRDGGLPPLLIDPIDFNAQYVMRQVQQKQAETQTE